MEESSRGDSKTKQQKTATHKNPVYKITTYFCNYQENYTNIEFYVFFPWPTSKKIIKEKTYSCTLFLLGALAFHCCALSPLWSLNANKSAEQQTLVFVSEVPASLLRAVGLGRGFSISVSFQPAVCILLQNLWSMLMRTAWLPGRTAGSWQSSFGGLSSQLGCWLVLHLVGTSKACMPCYPFCTPHAT